MVLDGGREGQMRPPSLMTQPHTSAALSRYEYGVPT